MTEEETIKQIMRRMFNGVALVKPERSCSPAEFADAANKFLDGLAVLQDNIAKMQGEAYSARNHERLTNVD